MRHVPLANMLHAAIWIAMKFTESIYIFLGPEPVGTKIEMVN